MKYYGTKDFEGMKNEKYLSEDELFELAGVTNKIKRYTPASIGKKRKIRSGERTMMADIRKVNFMNSNELRNLMPERVIEHELYHKAKDSENELKLNEKYKAIVGEKTEKLYSVMTKRYKPIQHENLLNATASCAENNNINIFGRMNDNEGTMNVHAIFANPDYHVNLLEKQEDPMMLGLRIYNSHDGTTSFGAEFIGIRMICCNYMAHGEILGKMRFKHFTEPEKISDRMSKMINEHINQIPKLQARMEMLRETHVDLDEATALLWGISIMPATIDAITKNIKILNPEIKDLNKITAYDVYNSGTAYVSYKAAEDNTLNTNLENSRKMQKLLISNIGTLIDNGNEKKERWEEKMINLSNTDVSIYAN